LAAPQDERHRDAVCAAAVRDGKRCRGPAPPRQAAGAGRLRGADAADFAVGRATRNRSRKGLRTLPGTPGLARRGGGLLDCESVCGPHARVAREEEGDRGFSHTDSRFRPARYQALDWIDDRGGAVQIRWREPDTNLFRELLDRRGPVVGRRPRRRPRAFPESARWQLLLPPHLHLRPRLPRTAEARQDVAEVDSGQEVTRTHNEGKNAMTSRFSIPVLLFLAGFCVLPARPAAADDKEKQPTTRPVISEDLAPLQAITPVAKD